MKAELASDDGGTLFADTMTTALGIQLLRNHSTMPSLVIKPSLGLSHQVLRRATDYINDNLQQDLHLSDIAAHTNLSVYHFARGFKQTTGVSPHQYVIQKRVEKAKHLLLRGDLSLREIALQVGFSDQSHLTRQFKRLLGVTPSKFLQ